MPIIPLLKSAPLAPLPAPVLDRERRPTVDNSPLIRAVGQLAEASRRPELPAEQLAAPYEALGSVGRAVAQTGSILGAVAIKRREAETIVQIGNAENTITARMARFHHWREEHRDPKEWMPRLEQEIEELKQTFAQDKTLTPQAREQVEMSVARWSTNARANIQGEADKTLFGEARDTYLAGIMRATASGNRPEYLRLSRAAEAGGYLSKAQVAQHDTIFDETAKQNARQAEADTEKQEYKAHLDQALRDPDGWLARNERAWEGKGEMWLRLRERALDQRRDTRLNAMEKGRDLIARGDITGPKQIDALQLPGLTEDGRLELHGYLARKVEVKKSTDRQANREANYVAIWDKIQTYDRNKDEKGIEYFKIATEIDEKVGEQAGMLRKALGARAFATPPKMEPREEVMQYAMAYLDIVFDPKRGSYAWESHYSDKREKIRKESAADRAKMMIQFNDWARRNPQDAQDVTKAATALDGIAKQFNRGESLGVVVPVRPAPAAPHKQHHRAPGTPAPKTPAPVPAPSPGAQHDPGSSANNAEMRRLGREGGARSGGGTVALPAQDGADLEDEERLIVPDDPLLLFPSTPIERSDGKR